MKQSFCTYFDRNYLTRGLALIESLQRQVGEFEIFIICMDEYTRLVLTELAIPEARLIPFHEVEQADPDLAACRVKRKPVEYIWTSTPAIISHVINTHPEIQHLTYVDADLYFFSNPGVVLEELGSKSVLIHEHRFPRRIEHLAENGRFNVGMLVFQNDALAREVLQDWRIRCIDWCHDYIENGKFGDQGYLTDWPSRFSQAKITENIGVGVAPWNQEQYQYSLDSQGTPYVDGTPVVFYHYHSLKILHPDIIVPSPDPAWRIPEGALRYCIVPYVEALRRAYAKVQSVFADFTFGYVKDAYSVALHQVVLSLTVLVPELQRIGLTQPVEQLDSAWSVFKGDQYLPKVTASPSSETSLGGQGY